MAGTYSHQPVRKENDLNQTSMIMFHVNLPGCNGFFTSHHADSDRIKSLNKWGDKPVGSMQWTPNPGLVSEKIPKRLEHALAHLLVPRCVTAIRAAVRSGCRRNRYASHVVNCRNISLSGWMIHVLVDGWTNPSEKHWFVKLGEHLPQF